MPERPVPVPVPVAVVGLGRLGTACAAAVLESEDLALAAIVRREARLDADAPPALHRVRIASDASKLKELRLALVCVPPAVATEVARGLLQHGIGVAVCARFPAAEAAAHAASLERAARHGRAPAVVGAGWDPGALQLVRGLALLLVPNGHTETRHHATATLHHTLAARNVPGVRDALCTDLRASEGGVQRYVYVELSPGSDPARVAEAIRADPLFFDEETIVVPVESTAALEAESHGVTLERRGIAAGAAHQRFLVEARFDVHAAAAQVMVGAARALVGAPPGVRTLLDVPHAALVGPRALRTLSRSA